MPNHVLRLTLLGLLLAAVWLAGCKRSGQSVDGYFKTHFQDESQFVVENTVSDLAEQMYYAKFHRLPPAGEFSVSAVETAASQFRAPVYELTVDLDREHRGLKTTLNVNGPIWAPELYDNIAGILAGILKVNTAGGGQPADTDLLAKLTDGKAATIETENETVSSLLENDFLNPALHQQAALLLGAFALRDHSGGFTDIRPPLCRMTAHLAMARYLGGTDYDINGNLAWAMLLTLMNDQTAALESLPGLLAKDSAVSRWVRALRARNDCDYRLLQAFGATNELSQVERVELFRAQYISINADVAWDKLGNDQKQIPDFTRIAEELRHTVGVGNMLYELALPLELRETAVIYQMTHGRVLLEKEAVAALNALPEHCFSGGADGQTHVRIIGWGQWADFLQRHLCNTVRRQYKYLTDIAGLPDDARDFTVKYEGMFGGLRLYPFVRRFLAEDAETCHRAMADGIKVTVATPQLVPAECWAYASFALSDNDSYEASVNPHVNEWHKHNPLPGTVYDMHPRLYFPSLTDRPDSRQQIDGLHNAAPADWDLLDYEIEKKFNKTPTYAQASELFGALSLYSVPAMLALAETVKDQPQSYERLLLRAADLEPSVNLDLAGHYQESHQDDKAAEYYEKSMRLTLEPIRVANSIDWLMHYYLKKNRMADARRVADFAGDIYSDTGLQTKAEFFEETGDYAGAFLWYSKIEERYDDGGPLMAFCIRYKERTGDDSLLKRRVEKVFPEGIEKAGLTDFKAAPADGVSLAGSSDLMQQAGLNQGDVIVALSGVRVHNSVQYTFERMMLTGPELDLIVWQGNGYHEIKASPPDHRFGVQLANYGQK